jgi:hypothetical protein
MLGHPDDAALSQMYAPHWTVLPNLGMDAIGAALLRIGTARYLDDWRASFDYVLLVDPEASMPTPHRSCRFIKAAMRSFFESIVA